MGYIPFSDKGQLGMAAKTPLSGQGRDRLHLGFDAAERVESPYAPFFRPDMVPLAEHVREALLTGGIAEALLPPVECARDLQRPGYWPVETGYAHSSDGAARVFVLTTMPAVTPAMWDWWFAWHGSEAQRYKLWHPRAHVHAAWADGLGETGAYVGRTSNVVEYVGSARLRLAIRFVPPSTLGLDEGELAAKGEVAICARGSIAGTPMETGWLIHHVRPVEGGSEMRSRFWIAGSNVRPRGMNGALGKAIGRAAAFAASFAPLAAADLLVHCAQEMRHLATILPALHSTFGPNR
jgi:hypothetical protein